MAAHWLKVTGCRRERLIDWYIKWSRLTAHDPLPPVANGRFRTDKKASATSTQKFERRLVPLSCNVRWCGKTMTSWLPLGSQPFFLHHTLSNSVSLGVRYPWSCIAKRRSDPIASTICVAMRKCARQSRQTATSGACWRAMVPKPNQAENAHKVSPRIAKGAE